MLMLKSLLLAPVSSIEVRSMGISSFMERIAEESATEVDGDPHAFASAPAPVTHGRPIKRLQFLDLANEQLVDMIDASSTQEQRVQAHAQAKKAIQVVGQEESPESIDAYLVMTDIVFAFADNIIHERPILYNAPERLRDLNSQLAEMIDLQSTEEQRNEACRQAKQTLEELRQIVDDSAEAIDAALEMTDMVFAFADNIDYMNRFWNTTEELYESMIQDDYNPEVHRAALDALSKEVTEASFEDEGSEIISDRDHDELQNAIRFQILCTDFLIDPLGQASLTPAQVKALLEEHFKITFRSATK